MEAFLLSIATNLTSGLMVAGARRLGDAALGDAQQRAVEGISVQILFGAAAAKFLFTRSGTGGA